MSLPGRLLFRFNDLRSMGWAAGSVNALLRPCILSAPPTEKLDDFRCEIHAMTSGYDWLNLVWALKSFYFVSGRKYALCVHDDGTLPPKAYRAFARLFPGSRVISRAEADVRMPAELQNYPKLAAFRKNNIFGIRPPDFVSYLRGDRLMMLDSDVLFFAKPEVLLRRVEDIEYAKNTYNLDVGEAYVVTPEVIRQSVGVEIVPHFNAGLVLLQREALDWGWMESFLGIPGFLEGWPFYLDQQLFALCASRYGAEPLPKEYDVRSPADPQSLVSHFIRPVRNQMYAIGMPRLKRMGILKYPTRP